MKTYNQKCIVTKSKIKEANKYPKDTDATIYKQ